MTNREAPTDPANERPDPEEEAFVRMETRLNELYQISVRTLEVVLSHGPKLERHEERIEVLEARVRLLEAQAGEQRQ